MRASKSTGIQTDRLGEFRFSVWGRVHTNFALYFSPGKHAKHQNNNPGSLAVYVISLFRFTPIMEWDKKKIDTRHVPSIILLTSDF